MRKSLTIFCIVALGLLWVGTAFAANNLNAYFKIDADLATKGLQETQPTVTGIGASKNIGFAIYSKGWDNAGGFTVRFEWDSAKATIRTAGSPMSGTGIIDDPVNINGKDITPPLENNLLTGSLGNLVTKNNPGDYEVSYFLTAGSPATTDGLVFFAAFRTTADFKDTDQLTIAVSVTVADGSAQAVEKSIGTRYFNVNSVAVKNATWGDVKSQFKNF